MRIEQLNYLWLINIARLEGIQTAYRSELEIVTDLIRNKTPMVHFENPREPYWTGAVFWESRLDVMA